MKYYTGIIIRTKPEKFTRVDHILHQAEQDEIIREFIEGTPIWYGSFPSELNRKDCAFCGVNPNKLLLLSNALIHREIRQHREARLDKTFLIGAVVFGLVLGLMVGLLL